LQQNQLEQSFQRFLKIAGTELMRLQPALKLQQSSMQQ